MDIKQRIKILGAYRNLNFSQIAELTEQSKTNLQNKLTRNDMKISELERIAKACGVGLEVNFILENGERI